MSVQPAVLGYFGQTVTSIFFEQLDVFEAGGCGDAAFKACLRDHPSLKRKFFLKIQDPTLDMFH